MTRILFAAAFLATGCAIDSETPGALLVIEADANTKAIKVTLEHTRCNRADDGEPDLRDHQPAATGPELGLAEAEAPTDLSQYVSFTLESGGLQVELEGDIRDLSPEAIASLDLVEAQEPGGSDWAELAMTLEPNCYSVSVIENPELGWSEPIIEGSFEVGANDLTVHVLRRPGSQF